MLLRNLQDLIADFYELELAADIGDYLVTDPQLLARLRTDCQPSSDETLLIAPGEEQLEVALYLNQAMLGRLIKSDPMGGLAVSNINDFCKVLEGVSHFVYLAWNASKDKCITRLELELQSEIDKYVTSRILIESQCAPEINRMNLREILFGAVIYRDGLAADEEARYRHANSMGGRYCCSLEQRFPSAHALAVMATELRAFYRMSQPEKLSHIHTAQFS